MLPSDRFALIIGPAIQEVTNLKEQIQPEHIVLAAKLSFGISALLHFVREVEKLAPEAAEQAVAATHDIMAEWIKGNDESDDRSHVAN